MRKLGLVGGIGPEATLRYYHDILHDAQERSTTRGFIPMTVESLDVYTVLRLAGVVGRAAGQQGAEAVVLGCTELPLALDDAVSPVPCLDAAAVHIRRIVDAIG